MSQGDIGLNVAQMIVELIRDNRKIVDRVTREQIAEFVGLLRQNKVIIQFISAHTNLALIFWACDMGILHSGLMSLHDRSCHRLNCILMTFWSYYIG